MMKIIFNEVRQHLLILAAFFETRSLRSTA